MEHKRSPLLTAPIGRITAGMLSPDNQESLRIELKAIRAAQRQSKNRVRAPKRKPFGSPKHSGKPAYSLRRNWVLWSVVWVQAIITANATKRGTNLSQAIADVAKRGIFEGGVRLLSNGTKSIAKIDVDKGDGRLSAAAIRTAFYVVENLYLKGPPRWPNGTPKLTFSGPEWLDMAIQGANGHLPGDGQAGIANAMASVFASDLLMVQNLTPFNMRLTVLPDIGSLESAATLFVLKPWRLSEIERAGLKDAQKMPVRPWGYISVLYRPDPVGHPEHLVRLNDVHGMIAPELDISCWRRKPGHPGREFAR